MELDFNAAVSGNKTVTLSVQDRTMGAAGVLKMLTSKTFTVRVMLNQRYEAIGESFHGIERHRKNSLCLGNWLLRDFDVVQSSHRGPLLQTSNKHILAKKQDPHLQVQSMGFSLL